MMKTPDSVSYIYLECTCVDISSNKWDKLMKGATKANVQKINKIVKDNLPELFTGIGLDCTAFKNLPWFNPYSYYKTKTHLVLIHSAIEYFLRYEI